MNLSAKSRTEKSKGAINAIRRSGNIPAVFYAPGQGAESIEVDADGFASAMRNIKPGTLATTVIDLDLNGKKKKVLVKDIQYDRTNYKVIHLDFVELKENTPIKVKVFVQYVGAADCVGIKLGGFFRQVIRHIEVKCLPKDIPAQFELDIRHLAIGQSLRVSDIAIAEGLTLLTNASEVIVVIAKR